MKASVCSKEYASTICDLFFYLIVLKGCYLNIKRNYAQASFSIAGFSMNPETENYFVASTEFFFWKIFAGEIICTLHGEAECAQITTHLSAPLPVNVNVFACLLCSNKFKWLNIHSRVVDVLGELSRA